MNKFTLIILVVVIVLIIRQFNPKKVDGFDLLVLFNFSVLLSAFSAGQEQFTNEITRISGDWLNWSTITASSILYSLTLYRNHPDIKDLIHARLKKIGR